MNCKECGATMEYFGQTNDELSFYRCQQCGNDLRTIARREERQKCPLVAYHGFGRVSFIQEHDWQYEAQTVLHGDNGRLSYRYHCAVCDAVEHRYDC